MSARNNDSIWPGVLFFGLWWAFTHYPVFEAYAFLFALAYCYIGWAATRMFSSAVHQRGFWGWTLLLELGAWYALALWLAPFETMTTVLLLWGVATPLLFVGNVWRRAYDRFPPAQGFMGGVLSIVAIAGIGALPVIAWRIGPDFFWQLLATLAGAAATCLSLHYGWRLAAPPPSGQYDARTGTIASFRRRGISSER